MRVGGTGGRVRYRQYSACTVVVNIMGDEFSDVHAPMPWENTQFSWLMVSPARVKFTPWFHTTLPASKTSAHTRMHAIESTSHSTHARTHTRTHAHTHRHTHRHRHTYPHTRARAHASKQASKMIAQEKATTSRCGRCRYLRYVEHARRDLTYCDGRIAWNEPTNPHDGTKQSSQR